MNNEITSVRYIVDDVDVSTAFYTDHFGFRLGTNAAPAFAEVLRGSLRLLLSGPLSSGGRALPDGRVPAPGGWNRLHFVVGDLLYPLLMQSSNHVADALAEYYGPENFVRWMNTEAQALGMNDTVYADPSGISPENVSTTEDLFRLAAYIAHKKSFIFGITKTPDRAIVASDGSRYTVINVNEPANQEPFAGGKIGHTDEARDTMVSLLSIQQGDAQRRVALIVLGSDDQARATKALAKWMLARAKEGPQTACVLCTSLPEYRRISF